MTDQMTRTTTIQNRTALALRNAGLQLIGHLPAAGQAIAMQLSVLSERAA
jgi:hypothetical protein